MTEIYFMAQGTAVMLIDGITLSLSAKDVVIVEPGEAHTFLSSSPDHFHFVIQTPGLIGDEAQKDKVTFNPDLNSG
jgi:mannose-6-phosphate isomerase-like protein (cupin superfamily)